jgi:hypothetical protein
MHEFKNLIVRRMSIAQILSEILLFIAEMVNFLDSIDWKFSCVLHGWWSLRCAFSLMAAVDESDATIKTSTSCHKGSKALVTNRTEKPTILPGRHW